EQDLARRDFTIHAMARRIGPTGRLGGLLDLYGGRADLEKKKMRLLHEASLADDPTRAIRAARYAARLGFQIEGSFPERLAAARSTGAFRSISGDRLRRALEELLHEARFPEAVASLVRHGVLDAIVGGWGGGAPGRAELAALPKEIGMEEKWTRLLAGAPPELRRSVAARLNFSHKLRRLTEGPA
ncbi:MAG: hypothetical protein ABIT01_13820, partial [Thermoanaerobaculia bacterium]